MSSLPVDPEVIPKPLWSFAAAIREDAERNADGPLWAAIEFREGEIFEFSSELTPGDRWDILQGMGESKCVGFMLRNVRPEQKDALLESFFRRDPIIPGGTVIAAMNKLIEFYSGRPMVPSNYSSPGPQPGGEISTAGVPSVDSTLGAPVAPSVAG